jgi:hypothetical protein
MKEFFSASVLDLWRIAELRFAIPRSGYYLPVRVGQPELSGSARYENLTANCTRRDN